MSALLEAGANPSRTSVLGAPLMLAARQGHLDAVRVLLRAKENPLLGSPISAPGGRIQFVPLDIAAWYGNADVIRELIQQFGVEGCGGESHGVQALRRAAICFTCWEPVDIMAILTDAGVVDTGIALCEAAYHGREGSVKFLLNSCCNRNNSSSGGGSSQARHTNLAVGLPT